MSEASQIRSALEQMHDSSLSGVKLFQVRKNFNETMEDSNQAPAAITPEMMMMYPQLVNIVNNKFNMDPDDQGCVANLGDSRAVRGHTDTAAGIVNSILQITKPIGDAYLMEDPECGGGAPTGGQGRAAKRQKTTTSSTTSSSGGGKKPPTKRASKSSAGKEEGGGDKGGDKDPPAGDDNNSDNDPPEEHRSVGVWFHAKNQPPRRLTSVPLGESIEEMVVESLQFVYQEHCGKKKSQRPNLGTFSWWPGKSIKYCGPRGNVIDINTQFHLLSRIEVRDSAV